MPSPLKAATLAVFALTAVASAMASDASLAGVSGTSHETIPAAIGTPEGAATATAGPASGAKDQVIFAAPAEVAQPLPAPSPFAPATGPATGPAASLAALVEEHGAPEALDEQMQCLAGAVYFEAKGESLAGQLAVARVVVNRAQSGRFPASLCGVVYQPGQFSFVRGRAMPAIATAGRAWREAVAIAQIALDDSWNSLAEGALFFHARRVSPGWNRTRIALIDNHIFYR